MKNTLWRVLVYLTMIVGMFLVCFPIYLVIIGATHESKMIGRGDMPLIPGSQFWSNLYQAWKSGSTLIHSTPVSIMMRNSILVAGSIAIGKVFVALLSAYAFVFFTFPLKEIFFWLIFVTLMLPLETRIISTYKVAATLKLLDTYSGLVLPNIVSATGTLLLRQTLRIFPREILEAARIDGAGAPRCLFSVVIPNIKPSLAALLVIFFLAGWNQYLWPLLITTKPSLYTMTIGIVKMVASGEALVDWGVVMAATTISLIVPLFIVIVCQKWLLMGLGASPSK
ncbi:MAG: ABC transporter permease subunit [Candidatus Hadarchaeum sp.]|uniref:ABC transporter permease subunit n=1 Tax=Candidatus Hadarchaeum sp. TaxID=2883567 RepID=UPI00317CB475